MIYIETRSAVGVLFFREVYLSSVNTFFIGMMILECNLLGSIRDPILLRTHCHNSSRVGGHVTIRVKSATRASVDMVMFVGILKRR